MKKLNPKQFRKIYLIGTIVPISLFLVLFIIGIFFTDEAEMFEGRIGGIVYFLIAFLFLMIAILVSLFGSKRYRTIQHEILFEEMNHPEDVDKFILIPFVEIFEGNKVRHGKGMHIKKEGFMMENELTTHLWKDLAPIILVEFKGMWLIALSEHPYHPDNWEGHLVVPNPLIMAKVESLTGQTINQDRLKEAKDKLLEYKKTVISWGTNYMLLIEQASFVIGLMGIGIAFGIWLSLNGLESFAAIAVANLILVPTLLLGYPKMFSRAWKKHYHLSRDYVGFALGRNYVRIPWKIIIRIKVTKARLEVVYQIPDPRVNNLIHTSIFPNNPLFLSRIKEYKETYQLGFSIVEDDYSNG